MMESRSSRFVIMVLAVTLAALGMTAQPKEEREPTPIDSTMYLMSTVRDHEDCALEAKNGRAVVAGRAIRNPSMTCPDMFSWLLFTEAVKERFWTRWGGETQVWPPEPFPLCSSGQGVPGKTCCTPGSSDNPEGRCPLFPGDKITATFLEGDGHPPIRHLEAPVFDHVTGGAAFRDTSPFDMAPAERNLLLAAEPECTDEDLDRVLTGDYESVGRALRQTSGELTVRNESFVAYVFANNLYNADGVAEIFRRNRDNIVRHAPYRGVNRSASVQRTPELYRVDLPADAVMIKSTWIHEEVAARLELEEPADHPFIKKELVTHIRLPEVGGKKQRCKLSGLHYMVGFHISSKDVPKWVWTTFEHVSLPGRCDITGCNDAYGYASSDAEIAAGLARNYLRPKQRPDGLNRQSMVFERHQQYPAEKIRPHFEQILDALEIGVTASENPREPTPEDVAWRSYRLKGSQVEYTDLEGRETVLGNIVIEGGFMKGSSCVTCHARAGFSVADPAPQIEAKANLPLCHPDKEKQKKPCVPYTFFKLRVFNSSYSDFGYALSHTGIPQADWFMSSGNRPGLEVLQTDFVWGFFNARPLVFPKAQGSDGAR